MVAMPYRPPRRRSSRTRVVGEAGAGAAERVAEGDRAAVDVEPLLVDAELADAGEDLGGEGLVELDQVDLVERRGRRRRGRGGSASTGPMPM